MAEHWRKKGGTEKQRDATRVASRMASQPGSRASNGGPKGNLGVDDRGVALLGADYFSFTASQDDVLRLDDK